MKTLIKKLKHAFAIDPTPADINQPLSKSLEKLARLIVKKRLSTPAILFFETVRPLSFIGSQGAHALGPLVKLFSDGVELDEIAKELENRNTLKTLVQRIEQLADEQRKR